MAKKELQIKIHYIYNLYLREAIVSPMKPINQFKVLMVYHNQHYFLIYSLYSVYTTPGFPHLYINNVCNDIITLLYVHKDP